MTITADKKALIASIIVAVSVLSLALVIMLKPVINADALSRVDIVPCVASSTFFAIPANTLVRLASTSTVRAYITFTATSTPGSTTILEPGYGQPNPSAPPFWGRPIQTASSSVTLNDENIDIGSMWARSNESAAQLMVTECLFQQ